MPDEDTQRIVIPGVKMTADACDSMSGETRRDGKTEQPWSQDGVGLAREIEAGHERDSNGRGDGELKVKLKL